MVGSVVAVTVMRVLGFFGCEYAGVGDVGGMVVVRAGHEYVGSTPGSGIVSSAADVLWMSVARGMRGVGGVCEMCRKLFLLKTGCIIWVL